MDVTIVDYKSGNISSVINSFKEVAKDKVNIEVTSDLDKIKSSDKVVLPGQGSFKSCIDGLNGINGLIDTLREFALYNKKPLLGICVGLQMFADIGYEEVETKGLGWISGKVSKTRLPISSRISEEISGFFCSWVIKSLTKDAGGDLSTKVDIFNPCSLSGFINAFIAVALSNWPVFIRLSISFLIRAAPAFSGSTR